MKNYVDAVIVDARIDEVTLDHAEQVMAAIPDGRASSTRIIGGECGSQRGGFPK
jgi:hypothetical protein